MRDECYGVGRNGGAEEEEEEAGWKIKLRIESSVLLDAEQSHPGSWIWTTLPIFSRRGGGRSLSRPLIGGKTNVEQELR